MFKSKEQNRKYMKKYMKNRRKNDDKFRKERNQSSIKYNKNMKPIKRKELMMLLGGIICNCDRKNCWHNGKCIVIDERCLQFDHINGNGYIERKKYGNIYDLIRYYLKHIEKAKKNLQVLCANCNWVKKHENKEIRGSNK